MLIIWMPNFFMRQLVLLLLFHSMQGKLLMTAELRGDRILFSQAYLADASIHKSELRYLPALIAHYGCNRKMNDLLIKLLIYRCVVGIYAVCINET